MSNDAFLFYRPLTACPELMGLAVKRLEKRWEGQFDAEKDADEYLRACQLAREKYGWGEGLPVEIRLVMRMQPLKRLYGVDGCRGGWVVAESDPTMERVSFCVSGDLGSLFAKAGPDCVIAIDIPIGLAINEPRICDDQARKLLGWPRRSSVFSPPARQALCATTFAEALRLNRDALKIGISKQTFCIMPKIREVDELVTPDKQQYMREVHPEVTFAQLNGGPMLHNKKTASGRAERIGVLNSVGVAISPESLIQERSGFGPAQVAMDDLVDALACLVTARHIHTGRCQSLGRPDQRDAKHLVMEIVTCARAAKSAPA